MIIKSLSRKSGSNQLLNYLFAKEEKLSVNNQKPLIIRHNIRSHSLDKWIQEFEKNESYHLNKRVNNVKVYHTILSFSNKDKKHITESLLKDIAKQYIKLRGLDSIYLGTVHRDKEHLHLHIVQSGTKYLTGEVNRISRTDFQKLKIAMDLYQKEKYPELIHSLPEHGKTKQKQNTKEYQTQLKNSRTPEKDQLLQTLNTLFTKSQSLDDFIARLKTKGYEAYYRTGKLTGIKTNKGLKFRFSRLGYPIEKIAALDFKENALKELGKVRERSHEHGRDPNSKEIER